jgi:mRNA interferase YafQ
MFNIVFTGRFRKDIKLLQKRGYQMEFIKEVIIILEETGSLPSSYSIHKLSGNYSGYWEAHVKPDWLIIWKLQEDDHEIWLTRTGSHSDLF